MLEQLKQEVYEANLLLPEYGLVIFTWGNVSAVSREQRRIVIKPSGVEYKELTPEKMAVTDLEGRKTGDGYEPSSDTLPPALPSLLPFRLSFAPARSPGCPPQPLRAPLYFHHIPRCSRSREAVRS